MAIKATRPIVRPTAPPVLSPPEWPFLMLGLVLVVASEGDEGDVGVIVTVCTTPVTVSILVIGVAVHVEEIEDLVKAVVIC